MTGTRAISFERLGTFAARRSASVWLALWAAAEAVFLPIVPDVGLCLLVLAAPRQAGRLFAAVLVGAVVGTLVLVLLATRAPGAAQAMLLALPGIDGAMLADAEARLMQHGLLGFGQFGPGPPLKVYTSEWLALGGDVSGALVGSILNRVTRIGPTAIAAIAAGVALGPWMRRHGGATLGVYAALWILVYAFLWA